MPLPKYPETLPLGLVGSRSYQHENTIIRTDRLKGLPRNRRWTSSPITTVSIEWLFSNEEAQIFEAWFAGAIADGADWFQIPLKYSGVLADYRCQFTGMYSGPNPSGPRMQKISAEIVIDKRPLIAGDWWLMPMYWELNGRSMLDVIMNRIWPKH
ncbi:hypothetical protein WG219_11130 [Ectopseudomonas mendocina]|uniref:Transposase n=1 Tax=Ectopseudomonas mendocina TaxID=300 RepID=A0ABZ2RA77_ECTME